MRRSLALAVIATFLITMISPIVVHASALINGNEGEEHHYKWVFMVYLDADNNLEGAGISDFNEMEMAGSTDQVAIVVMMDRIPGYDTSNGNWTDTRIYLVLHDTDPNKINSKLLADIGELDMGDPNTLVYFVNYTVHHFPADHYVLVLWDHGNAWKMTRAQGINVKGVCWDESSGRDYLTEQELIWAMGKISKFTHIDLIGFDVCLLGMVEVAYDLAPYADVFVASQDYEPWDGWYYTPFLQELDANPNMTPQELGKEIVKAYGYYYTKISPEPYTTLAAVDLKKFVKSFIPKLNYAALLMTYNVFFNPGLSYKIKEIRDATEFTGDGEYLDVYDLFDKLSKANFWISDYNPAPLLNQTLSAYNESLIASWAGANHPHAHGLSIYFPPSVDSYLEYRYWYYEQTNFANELFWSLFLDYYFYAFKPTKAFMVKISTPAYISPGSNDYALVEVSYGGKKVDPDDLSIELLTPNGSSISLDVKRVDVGLYLVNLPEDLNVSTAFIVVSSDYWFLQATDSRAFKVERLSSMVKEGMGNVTAELKDLRTLIAKEVDQLSAKLEYIGNGVVEIKTSLGEIEAKIEKIENGVVTLQTQLGEVNVSLNSLLKALDAKIVKLEGDVALVKSSLGEISLKLSELNASIEYIGNGVVEIKTSLGEIKGVITDVSGNVATIRTNLGSVRVSLSSISAKLDKVQDLAGLIPKISSQQESLAKKSEEIESTQRTVQNISIAVLVFVLIGLGVASLSYARRSSS